MRFSRLSRPKCSPTNWKSTTPPSTQARLNIAEIELSALVRQGLAHNIATMQELCEQAQRWQEQRNQAETTVNWRFTTTDARIKLKRLYPVLDAAPPPKRRRRKVTDSA